MVRADYQISSGMTYTYDIITASIDVTIDSNSASGDGYILDGHSFSSGTQVVVEITAVDEANNVDWNITSGLYTETYQSSLFGDAFGLAIQMLQPIILFEGYGNIPWNLIEDTVEEGTGLIILPFWDTDYFEGFENLADESAISEIQTETGFQDLTMEGNYAESGGNMIFDWYIEYYEITLANWFLFSSYCFYCQLYFCFSRSSLLRFS